MFNDDSEVKLQLSDESIARSELTMLCNGRGGPCGTFFGSSYTATGLVNHEKSLSEQSSALSFPGWYVDTRENRLK
jgi:hypothetical protein